MKPTIITATEPFWERYTLQNNKQYWNNSIYNLSYVLQYFFPEVITYAESVFKQINHPIFFNYFLDQLNKNLFTTDILKEPFSLSVEDLLSQRVTPKRAETEIKTKLHSFGTLGELLQKSSARGLYERITQNVYPEQQDRSLDSSKRLNLLLAERIERELQQSGFLLTYCSGNSELYLPKTEGDRIFIERVDNKAKSNKKCWEMGKAEECSIKREYDLNCPEDILLRLIVLDNWDKKRPIYNGTQLAGEKQMEKFLKSKMRTDVIKALEMTRINSRSIN